MNRKMAEISKRTLDIVGAGLGLLLLSPVFLIVAVFIKRTSPGPAFFRQERISRFGRPFQIIKFRSMRSDAEDLLRRDPRLWNLYIENNFKLPDGQDPRVTPIGEWLRKTSLDELPQLWNVLVGEMSLVGPRPLVREEIEQWYRSTRSELLSCRPGMTGLWQVAGRSDINYPERADLELRYVHGWSLAGDIAILLQTIKAVIAREGAF